MMLKSYAGVGPLRRPMETASPAAAVDGDLPAQQSRIRRFWKRPAMMHYNRLAVLVLLTNLAILVYAVTRGEWWSASGTALDAMANLVLANLALAILIRQQYVINGIFWLATRAPTSWPLSIRRTLGKVYHFGGLHVGGALSGTVWFALFAAFLTVQLVSGESGISPGTVATTYAILALLVLMVVASLPSIRARYHDNFELTHRFGGWTLLLLFWALTVAMTVDQQGDAAPAQALLLSPNIWVLAIITASIALPWLRLRKVPVSVTTPSSHVALARFNYGVKPFAGSSTAISRSPLREWHSFANVPAPDEDGYRLTISRAGDWTGAFIDDVPSHVWVKGIPTAGVANIETLFTKVIYVATGSGIGPCLPHLLAQEVPARLVWSTRSPRSTYGDELVDEILAVQPDAVIWDTGERGRPDLVKLAYKAYGDFDAEAVICISNKKLTWQVVYGMESRDIPAYGAIWDS